MEAYYSNIYTGGKVKFLRRYYKYGLVWVEYEKDTNERIKICAKPLYVFEKCYERWKQKYYTK